MRTLIAIALVASAGFSTLAQAQTPAAQADSSAVRIQGVAGRVLTEEQFADFGGKYMLTNGKRLTVSSNNYHYYAQIDGQDAVEIVPTARSNEFVAAKADMQINFDELRDGRNTDVVIRTGMRSNNVAVLASR
jgi:hypothetical protein